MTVRRQVDTRSGVVDCYKAKIGADSDRTLRPEIQSGAGAPSHAAPKGTLYINTSGTTTNNRLYINTDGSTTWTNVTCAA